MTARDLRAEFVRLVRQNGKTAVFITHQIREAMEIGDRVLVLHRPARIAFEARMDRADGDDAHGHIHEKILQVLALEAPAAGDGLGRNGRPGPVTVGKNISVGQNSS